MMVYILMHHSDHFHSFVAMKLFAILALLLAAATLVASADFMQIVLDEPEMCRYTECRGRSRGLMPCGKGTQMKFATLTSLTVRLCFVS